MAGVLKSQQELWKEQHGVDMTAAQQKDNVDRMMTLQSLYFEDREALALYGDVAYWESISDGALTVTSDPTAWAAKCTTEHLLTQKSPSTGTGISNATAAQLEQLGEAGYAVLPGATGSDDPVFEALERTAANLAAHGWPPGFLFVYDEMWALIANLWETYGPILGEDCWMEPDLNCWRLRAPPPAEEPAAASSDPPTTYVGANFGKSHRDMTYAACHDEETEAYQSLNCWVPINPHGCDERNGCMRVIPIEHDDYYWSTGHPYHMNTAKALSFVDDVSACAVPLPAAAGAVVTWTPSLIHWGGACAPGVAHPRMSIAATFRKNGTKRSVYGAEREEGGDAARAEASGPPSIQRKDVAGVCLSRRLAYVAKGIISFAHWYPGFPGLSVARLEAGSSVMAEVKI